MPGSVRRAGGELFNPYIHTTSRYYYYSHFSVEKTEHIEVKQAEEPGLEFRFMPVS